MKSFRSKPQRGERRITIPPARIVAARLRTQQQRARKGPGPKTKHSIWQKLGQNSPKHELKVLEEN
jgi:hypothetical protein